MKLKMQNFALAAGALAMSLAMAACTSNGDGTDGSGSGGDGSISGGGSTGGSTGGLSNDGGTPTNVTVGGGTTSGTTGGTSAGTNFICTRGAKLYGDVTTEVGTGGLVGGPLTTLLNDLGGTTLTQLLNSINNPNNVIDGNLDTYASVSLTAGLLGSAIDTIDESVVFPSGTTVPAGKFAVFGLSFPNGTVDLSLVNSVTVSTFLNSTKQESNTESQSALTLLNAIGGSSPATLFLGVKTTLPYDTAQVSLTPGLLTASVGDAMRIHELCVDGTLTAP